MISKKGMGIIELQLHAPKLQRILKNQTVKHCPEKEGIQLLGRLRVLNLWNYGN
jgi:hypothetical protein